MLKTLKKILVAGAVVVSTLISNMALASSSPYVLMQQTADKLFGDIKANQSKIKANPDYLRTIVRNDLMPHVHVKYAGQLVLGKNLASASDAQKEAFFGAFGQFIEQSYAQVLTQYTDQKVQIENEKPVGDKSIVSIRVNVLQNGNAQPIKLDFKWRKNSKTGQWQAYDMAAEGVSMVATKQNEWSGVLRQKGIDALTAQVAQSAKQPITLGK
ncbi:ABC-type transport system involved in resistance to organic solvent [Bibersteinia trehalosi USDA-ARS-USMARC-188]|uniref:ABC-type transport system involved in resistance to organic solvent n=4 Tax=Bibersteinia trehalosi TaxID=47735 RepID=W0R908_BIBTR|nr:phospholipid-binding protein MlaC [Bibersteinia trehalosi]AGH38956.1 ABC-type transport system involved in resistance to organic solvent [Bibersteinia trehalosi USDA-ARS-USMARC-192]AHG81247.1 ABC-type transport system involved in resistance to organic solvent [Bibersteinia trehalosi USDA-ARS-USMARC-188]AHG83510.1 ABC-type transport system involved in resistance to organic solvent [Bibersteinia trehalosi USDA-ARS-USMARC-189]AHG86942.1 ABC-type transport system involved in resistance to organi